ncbi:MAG: hypothetical protein HQK51_19865 [Oligoflexia bacterium]|nr:hypothetical protein [Oligoflexia bacterium]
MNYRRLITKKLMKKGHADKEIADILNSKNVRTCRLQSAYSAQNVGALRRRYGLVSPLHQVRLGKLKGFKSIHDIAPKIPIDQSWIYRKISNGTIKINKHPVYQCYLFPTYQHPLQKIRDLYRKRIMQISFTKEH